MTHPQYDVKDLHSVMRVSESPSRHCDKKEEMKLATKLASCGKKSRNDGVAIPPLNRKCLLLDIGFLWFARLEIARGILMDFSSTSRLLVVQRFTDPIKSEFLDVSNKRCFDFHLLATRRSPISFSPGQHPPVERQ